MDRISSRNVQIFLSENFKSGNSEKFHIVYWIEYFAKKLFYMLFKQGNILKTSDCCVDSICWQQILVFLGKLVKL